MRDANLGTIKPQREFETHKVRLIVLDYLLNQRQDLRQSERRELTRLIISGETRSVQMLLDGTRPATSHRVEPAAMSWNSARTVWGKITGDSLTPAQLLLRDADGIAKNTSHIDFLSHLEGFSAHGQVVEAAVAEVKSIACSHFNTAIPKLVNKVTHGSFRIQEEECTRYIQRDTQSQQQLVRKNLLRDFICQIEELSQSESTT